MPDAAEVLLIESGDGFQTWILNRPAVRNALDPDLVEALVDAVQGADADPDVRVVVLRGNGPSFCAGADLAHLSTFAGPGQTPVPFLRGVVDLTLAIEASSTVFVAALHGHAIAGGFEIALACDIVLAVDDTLIGDGHVRRNLVPGGGASRRMVTKLGPGRASWMALTGATERADTLATSGWIRRTAPADGFDRIVAEEVATLLAAEPAAQSAYKALLNEDGLDQTASALARELEAFAAHWTAQDVPAGLHDFLRSTKGVA